MTRRLLIALLLLLAFPSAAAAIPPVYVTNQSSATISALKPGADGSLTPIGGPVATGTSPSEVAVTPDGRFAYVANSTTPGSVSAFAIGADGALSGLGAPAPTGGNGTNALAIAKGGTRLYATNGSGASNSVTTFAIGADGALSVVGAPVPAGGIVPRSVVASPDGSHLYVANNSTSTVTTFGIGGAGEPIQQGAPLDPPGHDTFDLAISPGGDRLYVANFGTSDVTTLAVAADGSLSALGDPVPTGTMMPRAMALSGDGTRLFVTNNGAPKTVSEMAIGADGRPSLVGAPVLAGDDPYGVAFSPNGALGFVAGSTGTLSAFRSDGDGAPAAAAPSAPTGGTQARGVAVRPAQGPTAAFTAKAGRAGSATTFDASGSSDPDGAIAGRLWNFGDGTEPAGGTSPKHVYKKPGSYTVTLTTVDDDGCSTVRTFTGKTVACNGSPAAATTRTVKVEATARAAASLRTTRASLSRNGRVTLKLACSATGIKRCAGTVRLTARLPGAKKAATIGSASFSAKAGRTVKATVKLSKGARSALAKRGLGAAVRLATRQATGKPRIATGKLALTE